MNVVPNSVESRDLINYKLSLLVGHAVSLCVLSGIDLKNVYITKNSVRIMGTVCRRYISKHLFLRV